MSALEFIILLILALGLLFRLYRVFGTDNKESGIKIILKPVDKTAEKQILQNISQIIDPKDNILSGLSTDSLKEQENQEQEKLNKEIFLNGAKKVFELILSAFNQGDLTPVRELMSKKVFDAFNQVIENRRADNITSEVDFICFDKSETFSYLSEKLRHISSLESVEPSFTNSISMFSKPTVCSVSDSMHLPIYFSAL